jgi:MFS family permease
MGALSDSSGRRLAFIICFIIFIVANIGLALQTNYIALLLLRILQAMGGTAGIALSYAVVADVSTSAERGVYMGYAGAGILAGPAFGPTIGGILAYYLGWRSTFWFLVIYAGVLLVLFVFFFPETCRNIVGNGSIPPTGLNRSVISCIQARKNRLQRPSDVEFIKPPKRKFTLPNPLVTFRICLEKESGIILLYNGLFFTAMMTTVYGIPYLYGKTYNLSELHLGLCFIANGVGSMASSLTMGYIVDWNFRRHAKLAGMPIVKGQQQDLTNFNIERVRLEIVLPCHVIGTIGLLIFGWTVHYGTHIAFPEIGLVVIGFGISGAYNITNNLLIDLHRDVPAATTAAVNFARCLLSAGGAAAIIPMVNAMGVGWTFTFMAAVSLLLFGVAVWIMKCGMGWRQEKAERGSREMEEKERSKGP